MNTQDLDMTPRYVPDRTIIAIYGKRWGLREKFAVAPVTQMVFHPAGTHKGPIKSDWACVQVVTEHGSRWYGCVRAYINSELRMVIVGTPERDEVRMKWEIVPEDLR